MKLVDLKLDTNPVHLENLSKLTKWIEDNEDHRNKTNYINLESIKFLNLLYSNFFIIMNN